MGDGVVGKEEGIMWIIKRMRKMRYIAEGRVWRNRHPIIRLPDLRMEL